MQVSVTVSGLRASSLTLLQPGTRVTVYIKGVPREAAKTPLTIFGLLQYEHKKTVLNFSVQRNTEYDGSVRSKDPLILCVGPRRLRVNPVYSQLTRGGGKGTNNVHKFERYLRHGTTAVATICYCGSRVAPTALRYRGDPASGRNCAHEPLSDQRTGLY